MQLVSDIPKNTILPLFVYLSINLFIVYFLIFIRIFLINKVGLNFTFTFTHHLQSHSKHHDLNFNFNEHGTRDNDIQMGLQIEVSSDVEKKGEYVFPFSTLKSKDILPKDPLSRGLEKLRDI